MFGRDRNQSLSARNLNVIRRRQLEQVRNRAITAWMNDTILTVLQYYGAVASTIAALIVSLDLGRKWTGYAMVIFVTSSVALIGWGFLQPESEGIGMQNVVLLIINAVGVWRYLLSPDRRKAAPAG
jgi:hypothetical protein